MKHLRYKNTNRTLCGRLGGKLTNHPVKVTCAVCDRLFFDAIVETAKSELLLEGDADFDNFLGSCPTHLKEVSNNETSKIQKHE